MKQCRMKANQSKRLLVFTGVLLVSSFNLFAMLFELLLVSFNSITVRLTNFCIFSSNCFACQLLKPRN
jgi:hypothetical protein